MPVDVLAEVLANSRLSDDYCVVALAAPEVARLARPGQFVMLKPSAGLDPLLRRPFSVFEILREPDGTPGGITILNKRVGTGTTLLYNARPGDHIACLGPLGTPFEIVGPPTRAWLVAGGVGLAPFATLAAELVARGTDTTLFYGARRAKDLHRVELFEPIGVRTIVATEDGSRGDRGFISEPLARELGRLDPHAEVRLYACGPTAMMRAVSVLAAQHGRRCDVSLEQTMGCGMGGCYSCVVKVRDAGSDPHFVRSCLAGPIFDARVILWDELGGH